MVAEGEETIASGFKQQLTKGLFFLKCVPLKKPSVGVIPLVHACTVLVIR